MKAKDSNQEKLAFCTYLINVNIDTKDSETYE